MKKVYKVEAVFEDFESSSYITIGVYTDENLAENAYEKWYHFFKSKESILNEPPNWDPKDDDWYEEGDEFASDWRESAQYHILLAKYEHIRSFSRIVISEEELNAEVFVNSFTHFEPMKNIMIEFNREWNLNKIIGDGK